MINIKITKYPVFTTKLIQSTCDNRLCWFCLCEIKQTDTTLQHKPYTQFQLPVATNLIAVSPFNSAQSDQLTDVHTTTISFQLA